MKRLISMVPFWSSFWKIKSICSRVGKVWNWSNLVLIKVVVFFIKFDKNFVWTKYFFHTYGFLSLEGPLLAGLCSRKPGPVSRACSKVKKPYVWKKYFVQTNFLSNFVKKSTTFINTKLLQFHTLPTLLRALFRNFNWQVQSLKIGLKNSSWNENFYPKTMIKSIQLKI